MVDYPLPVLMNTGIRDILIISGAYQSYYEKMYANH